MKRGRRRHVVPLCTDRNKNTLPKQAKVLLVMGSTFWMAEVGAFILQNTANSWELTGGNAAVSQGKLPGWDNSQYWSTRVRKGKVHHWKQQGLIIQMENMGLDLQPDSTSRATGAFLMPKCLHEMYCSSKVGEEPGMCSVLSCPPGLEVSKQGHTAGGSYARCPSLSERMTMSRCAPTGQFML